MRIVAWNVWGVRALARASGGDRGNPGGGGAGRRLPGGVLVTPGVMQPELVVRRVGLGHSVFAGAWQQEDWVSGFGLVSRRLVTAHERRALRGADGGGAGSVLIALIDRDSRADPAVRGDTVLLAGRTR